MKVFYDAVFLFSTLYCIFSGSSDNEQIFKLLQFYKYCLFAFSVLGLWAVSWFMFSLDKYFWRFVLLLLHCVQYMVSWWKLTAFDHMLKVLCFYSLKLNCFSKDVVKKWLHISHPTLNLMLFLLWDFADQ